MSDLSALFVPGRFGRLTVPNRIVMAPLSTRMTGPDGVVSAREAAFFAARARGGAGLLVTGPVLASTDHEPFSGGMARADDDAVMPGVRRLVEAVHEAGGLLSVQVSPGSGRLGPAGPDGADPVSSSPNPWMKDPSVRCRPLTDAEILRLVERFGAAVARLAEAGVDAVDVHGHGGYLVDQFLSSLWNRRTDAWGGSVENRARFAVALVTAAREAAPGLPVSFRLSTVHHLPGGRELAESEQVADLLQEAGIDLLIAEEGSAFSPAQMAPVGYLPPATHLHSASVLARRLDIPVMVAGALTPELAATAVAEGDIAFAGMGRALLADPDLPNAVAAGRLDRVRPCVRCDQCLDAIRSGRTVRCAVNPLAGRESGVAVRRAEHARRVVVVGGGPAGLEAARVAARRGHVVDLYEASDRLGGILADAATAPFKGELHALVQWYRRALDELGVAVHLAHALRPGSAELSGADEVIVAGGGRPVWPVDVPGLDRPEVVDVLAMHAGAGLGARVVVTGGGLSGGDAALTLALAGHEVTVVDAATDLAPAPVPVRQAALLVALAAHGVEVRTGHRLVAVRADGVHLETPDGPTVLPADSVVLALGRRPRADLVGSRLLEDPRVRVVGDAAETGDLGDAIRAGWDAALAI